MFGFSGGEFLLIVIVIAVVVGPSRLPEYTRTLTRLVKRLRVFIESTKEQIAEEVGPELADLDFSELDPRQYDPRKIVREALGDDIDAIKKDLTQPFKSVKEAATEASGSAVKEAQEINEADRAKGTLAERIEAKKQEAKAARELSTVEAAGAATAAFVAQRDAQAAKEAAAKEQAAQSEDLQNKDVPEQAALTAAEPEVTEETTQTGTPTAEAPAGEQSPAGDADSAKAGIAETASEAPTGWTADHKKDEDSAEHLASLPAQESAAAAAAVPPTVIPEEDGAAASRATRPLSPRDIVRAANAAARTRAEARETTPIA